MNRKLLPAIALSGALVLPALAAENDPTRPIDYKPATRAVGNVSGLTLQSLLIAQQRKHAVINGQRVKEGDRVSGAKVLQITAEGVVVEHSGKRRTLKLNTVDIKRARGNADNRDDD